MKRFSSLAFILAAFAAAPVLAIEAPKDSFLLWSAIGDYQDRDAKSIFHLDLDPATPGIETVGLAEGCTVSAQDANDKISVTFKMSFSAKSADGSSTVFTSAPTQPSTVTSLKFPDPREPRFQCGGVNETRYGVDGNGEDLGVPNPGGMGNCGTSGAFNGGNIGDALCDDLPQVFNVGTGLAKKAGTRHFMVGSAARGDYQNNLPGESDVDFSRFNIATYDMAGTRVLNKTFGAFDTAGAFLLWELSGVGNYLDDGAGGVTDEIRLIYVSGTATTQKFKYVYYDIVSGAQIGTPVTVSTPCPGPCRNN